MRVPLDRNSLAELVLCRPLEISPRRLLGCEWLMRMRLRLVGTAERRLFDGVIRVVDPGTGQILTPVRSRDTSRSTGFLTCYGATSYSTSETPGILIGKLQARHVAPGPESGGVR